MDRVQTDCSCTCTLYVEFDQLDFLVTHHHYYYHHPDGQGRARAAYKPTSCVRVRVRGKLVNQISIFFYFFLRMASLS